MSDGLQRLAVLVVIVASLVFVSSALASESEPAIVNAQATSITERGATLEAQINPGNSETTYEFWLECGSVATSPCEPIATQKQGGRIAAGGGEQSVSVSVTGLQPGGSYSFRIAASNAAGRVEAHLSFETQPLGACAAGCPYKTGVSLQAEELGRLLGEGAPAREAARRQAAKEQAEREAAAAKADQPVVPTMGSSPTITTGSVALVSTGVMIQGNSVALVKLDCLGVASCNGKLTLTARSVVEAKGAKGKQEPARQIQIGVMSFSIMGDEMMTLKVNLDAVGRALLKTDHDCCSASLAILELAPGPKNIQTMAVRLIRQEATKTRKP